MSSVQVNESANNVPSVIVSDTSKHSFANIAARPTVVKTNGIKQRSNSQKRGVDDADVGFNPVKKKKTQGKSGKGTFKVPEGAEN